jgi:hypothetical protein
MSRDPIPEDATIADVLGRLNAPERYVREVLGHMWECRKQHGAASVRIGVTGEGRAPHYQIEYPNPNGSGDPHVYKFYNGSSHKEISDLGQGGSPEDLMVSDDEPVRWTPIVRQPEPVVKV